MSITKTQKLINVLASGKEYTSTQLSQKVGLENVSSTIHRLRQEGFRIFTNVKNTKNGVKSFYRMAA